MAFLHSVLTHEDTEEKYEKYVGILCLFGW